MKLIVNDYKAVVQLTNQTPYSCNIDYYQLWSI